MIIIIAQGMCCVCLEIRVMYRNLYYIVNYRMLTSLFMLALCVVFDFLFRFASLRLNIGWWSVSGVGNIQSLCVIQVRPRLCRYGEWIRGTGRASAMCDADGRLLTDGRVVV